MYATPMLFSRAASELSASGATASATIGAVAADFLAANKPLKGNAIPRNTAMTAASGDADRMRSRIVVSIPVSAMKGGAALQREPHQFSRPSAWPSTAFAGAHRAALDAPALRS